MKTLGIIALVVLAFMAQFGLIIIWHLTRKDYRKNLKHWAKASRELDYINSNFSGAEYHNKMDEWEEKYLKEDWERIKTQHRQEKD